VAFVDCVVHADDVRVDQAARGDRGREHLDRRLAAGLSKHHCDRSA
jgi:hypothetical protein